MVGSLVTRGLPGLLIGLLLTLTPAGAFAQGTRSTEVYRRLKREVDAIPLIDTHDHLWPFDQLPALRQTRRGRGVNLAGLWQNSYLSGYQRITPWEDNMEFADWWRDARDDFDNVRSLSFYRYQLPAFRDLYGVDFETLTDEQASQLNDRIFDNYRDQKWLYHVVTERANIELMFNDTYWSRLEFVQSYPWEVLVFNVTSLVSGFHPSEYENRPANNPFKVDSPYDFARKHGLPMNSLDDYLQVLDRLFLEARDKGAVCLKTTLAYQRTLQFDRVPRERAEAVFGKPRSTLTPAAIKDFEDFILWRICELAARYDFPFQIHTGQARIQGSNPMLLVDLLEGNPKTKFILFHGGFPWVGETAVILQKHGWHCWVDSVWLPILGYSTAKRAFIEWLDAFPSNRLMWGADCNHAEGIYGATEFHRQCVTEALAEKVLAGDLREEQALRIARQVFRDNALELFPQLRDRLWKHKGLKLEPQPAPAAAP
ncbi:MAG: amidohydrolase family protein [Planctomycetaceae bacterium]|jgi:predicted TIM-barrel fold metal-dependent hydrolase